MIKGKKAMEMWQLIILILLLLFLFVVLVWYGFLREDLTTSLDRVANLL